MARSREPSGPTPIILCSECGTYQYHHAGGRCERCHDARARRLARRPKAKNKGKPLCKAPTVKPPLVREAAKPLPATTPKAAPAAPAPARMVPPRKAPPPAPAVAPIAGRSFTCDPDWPLLPLILAGQGGFTKALRAADRFVRNPSNVVALGEPSRAWMAEDGGTVRVTFEGGTTKEFGNGSSVHTGRQVREESSHQFRLSLARSMLVKGTMTHSEIVEAVGQSRAGVKYLKKWFVKVGPKKSDPWTLTDYGRQEVERADANARAA